MYPPLGRPREFKFKMRAELVDHVARGESVEKAAQIVGVSLRTVQREAKHNEQFHHDLELAKLSAPRDLEHQMQEAARTHWRAAAWLLERKDPERFGKRPANSCSPAMLQDACDFLIEQALEATPEEHREAVYRRMCTAADQMYEVIMPDRSVERRCLATVLSRQTTPLSCQIEDKLRKNPDYVREQDNRELATRPWRQVERLLGSKQREERSEQTEDGKPPRWRPANGKRQDSADLDGARNYPTDEEIDAYYDKLDEKRGLAKERVAERERDRELVLAAMERNQRDREKIKRASSVARGQGDSATGRTNAPPPAAGGTARSAPSSDGGSPVPPPVYGQELSDCSIERNCETSGDGLMSPKTCFRDKSPATERGPAQPAATKGSGEAASEAPPHEIPGLQSDATNAQGKGPFQTLLDQFRKQPPNGHAA